VLFLGLKWGVKNMVYFGSFFSYYSRSFLVSLISLQLFFVLSQNMTPDTLFIPCSHQIAITNAAQSQLTETFQVHQEISQLKKSIFEGSQDKIELNTTNAPQLFSLFHSLARQAELKKTPILWLKKNSDEVYAQEPDSDRDQNEITLGVDHVLNYNLSDQEVRWVLAHELGHIKHKHVDQEKKIEKNGGWKCDKDRKAFCREQECQADRFSHTLTNTPDACFTWLVKTGLEKYDKSVDFDTYLKKLKNHESNNRKQIRNSSHPSDYQRACIAYELIKQNSSASSLQS
jgi:Zn-dependent protease with chaperone function